MHTILNDCIAEEGHYTTPVPWPCHTTACLHRSASGIPLSAEFRHLLRGRPGRHLQSWLGQQPSDELTWHQSTRLAGTPSVSWAMWPKTASTALSLARMSFNWPILVGDNTATFLMCTSMTSLSQSWPLTLCALHVLVLLLLLLSASLYVSKRGAYWDRLCRDVVGWLSRVCTVAKRCILGL